MASTTLGRVACPIGCGHPAAQVKLKTDKAEGKTAFPYVHCAGCGIQLHTRNRDQAATLLKMTRAEKGLETPPAAIVPPEPFRVPEVQATPPVVRPAAPDGIFALFRPQEVAA